MKRRSSFLLRLAAVLSLAAASACVTPAKVYRPARSRFGHGTSTAPSHRGGNSSAPNGTVRSTPDEVNERNPAPTSVIVAAKSPAPISNCTPLSAMAAR